MGRPQHLRSCTRKKARVTSEATKASTLAREVFLLAAFCGFLFFFGLGSFGLIGADEPRYAQVAREMLAHHDWVTPTLGGVPWLEKPPLYYWQAMMSFRILGVTDFAARLPSALDASAFVFAAYFFLRRFRPGYSLDGALICASSAAMIGFARAASTDMPLAAMLGVAMLSWYAWRESSNRVHLLTFYAFLALGSLAKGPIAPFLAAVLLGGFALATRDFSLIRRTLYVPGILLFFVIALPWYIAVQIKNPDFFRIFILEHNLARFGTNLYRHKEPFWYYIPVALVCFVPWAIFLIASSVAAVKNWLKATKERQPLTPDLAWNIFLLLWIVVPIAFFSLSQSKLPGYILPAIPPGTLLLAEFVRQKLRSDSSYRNPVVIALHAVLAAAVIAPALMVRYIVEQHHMPWNRPAATSVAIAAVTAICIMLALRGRLGLRSLRTATLIPIVLAVWISLRLGGPSVDDALSARPIARHVAPVAMPVAVLHTSREIQFGLAFYRNSVIARYESGEVPSQPHIVIAPSAWSANIQDYVPGRRVLFTGHFAPQNMDFFLVSGQ